VQTDDPKQPTNPLSKTSQLPVEKEEEKTPPGDTLTYAPYNVQDGCLELASTTSIPLKYSLNLLHAANAT